MKHLIAALFFSMLLHGCVTNDAFTGTGPVKLSDRQQSAFDKWAHGTTDQDSLYFFLVRGGGSFWVFCPETRALCKDSTEFAAFQRCEARYGKGNCKMYGVYGDVVWQFDKPADPNWWNENRGPVTDEDTRPIKINWAGQSAPLNGELHYRKETRVYKLAVTIPGETTCTGVAEFTRNTWVLSCRNGVSAKGTFLPLGKGKGSVGEGIDSRGNRIDFRVAPAAS